MISWLKKAALAATDFESSDTIKESFKIMSSCSINKMLSY